MNSNMAALASLNEIVDALEIQFHEASSYLDRTTGHVSTVSREALAWAEDSNRSAESFPQWQQEELQLAARIVDSNDFIPLPTEFDINSWGIMQEFAASQDDSDLRDHLLNSIRGRGAFRRFKDMLYERNLWDAWNSFHREALRRIAVEWCEEHHVQYGQ